MTLHGKPGMEVPHAEVHNAYANFMNESAREAFRAFWHEAFIVTVQDIPASNLPACGQATTWVGTLLMSIPMCLSRGFPDFLLSARIWEDSSLMQTLNLTGWIQLGTFVPFFRNHSAVDTCRQGPCWMNRISPSVEISSS